MVSIELLAFVRPGVGAARRGAQATRSAEGVARPEFTITVAPIALGSGHPLFAGMGTAYPLRIVSHHTYAGGMVQLKLVPP